MVHEGSYAKLTDLEMAAHLDSRLAAITAPRTVRVMVDEQDADGNPVFADTASAEYDAKEKYETERAQQGWTAGCTCGWEANNPLPTEGDAEEALTEHYKQPLEFTAEG